jgi:hypothetical protein
MPSCPDHGAMQGEAGRRVGAQGPGRSTRTSTAPASADQRKVPGNQEFVQIGSRFTGVPDRDAWMM